MKKIEFGLFALAIIVANNIGSIFGVSIVICLFMIASGLIEEIAKRPRKSKTDSKKEDSK